MPLNLGDEFPNFEADTTEGPIKFHDWKGDQWALVCSHPADFTPVCTTELGTLAKVTPKFAEMNCKPIAVSCDPVDSHKAWIKDIQANASLTGDFPYPIIADPSRELATKLGMIDPVEKDSAGMPLTCRAVFIVGPKNKLKLSILYPATTGRSFDEILRVVESLQLTATQKVATPANWQSGEACMVLPSVKAEELEATFPKGVSVADVPSGKKYMRTTPQPNK